MRKILLSTAAMLAAVTPALAQVAIPDTIVTATRVPTPLERVPAAITVITRQQIEERGYATLNEALASVPGVRVDDAGLDAPERLFADLLVLDLEVVEAVLLGEGSASGDRGGGVGRRHFFKKS